MSDQMLRFEILEDGDVVAVEDFDGDVVKVGKLGSSHLKIEDPSVSRIHAVVEEDGGGYSVVDLGSAQGTYVNGEKVEKEPLSDGDALRFGNVEVRFSFISASEARTGGAGAAGAAQTVTTPEGDVVEPYTLQGFYDDAGRYIPGYYDEQGSYHYGYGYTDDQGQWQVAYGFYDAQGQWVQTGRPVKSATDIERMAGPSDREQFEQSFFNDEKGDTLEVAQLWGDHVIKVETFKDDESVTVGTSDTVDFLVADGLFDGDEEIPLLARRDGVFVLLVRPEMQGRVRINGQEMTLAEARESGAASRMSGDRGATHAIRLGPTSSAEVVVDDTTFFVHYARMPAAIGGTLPLDKASVPFLLISFAAHVAFLFLAMTLPGQAGDLSLDQASQQDRFVEMMVKPDKEKEPDKPDWLKSGDDKKAAKHKGEETKAGKKSAESTNNQMRMKGPPDNADPKLKKERNREVAMNSGALQAFQGEQVSSKWGSAQATMGSDASHALGNLDGESGGAAKGFGGLGMEGAGRGGGGGMSESGVGIGSVGTAGRGGGGKGGSGYGSGEANLGEKKQRKAQVVPQRPDVRGSLDKEIIRKVVRQHRREIKYCYESELQKNPQLKGRVKMQFTISPSGSVIAATPVESTLGNPTVESCISNKIRHWTFPEPKGGGIVKVKYPFNFESS
jgi:outer membrane biosynthesis protein TonB